MSKARIGILKENVKLFELIYQFQTSPDDREFYNESMTEAILMAICAQKSLIMILLKEIENNITITPSNN